MILNKFHCPICKVTVNEVPAQHFRYVHQIPPDDIINVLFAALAELDERLTNLTELLEIT